jgi:predicted membrane protein
VMSVVLLSTSSLDLGVLSEGVGSRVAIPLSVSDASGGESLGVGELEVDLRQLEVPAGTTAKLKYRMGVGEMVITLPDDIPVRVTASLEGGELDVLDQHRNGGNLSAFVEDPGYADADRRIEIVITMGFGNVQVSRAPF